MLEFLKAQFENQFLSGGAFLMLMGAGLALLRRIPFRIYTFLHRRCITTVDITDQDEAFYWMQEWLAQHPYSNKSRLLSVTTENSSYAPADANRPLRKEGGESFIKEMINSDVDTHRQPKIYFTPAPGIHLLRFENNWILLYRIREKQEGSSGSRYWREQFIIKTLVRDRQFIRRLILKACSVANPPEEERVTIFCDNYGHWKAMAHRFPRDFDSVILNEDVVDEIINKTESFLTSSEWYRDRGIPYQMGFLFHGPPGNGKTSTSLAIASRFKRDIYLARVDGATDASFRQMMSSLPKHSILLIEDVDCFFTNRCKVEQAPGAEPFITFSGFLNAIDGVMGTEGRIIIFTSNYPNKLDKALLRPGRIDHQIEFGNATEYQAKRLFLRFFPEDEENASDFALKIGNYKYCMAELQKILLDNRGDPRGAVKSIPEEKIYANV